MSPDKLMASEAFADRSSVALHCATLGMDVGASGSWVLLLHGLFGSGDNLGMLGKTLAAGHRVALVDLRNHGQSPHSAQMDLTLLATDIAALQDRLGTGPAALVGHSLGGKVAMQLALTAPERVNRLVVADIAPVQYPPLHNDVLRGLQAVDLATITSRRDADAQLQPHIAEEGVRQFLLKSLARDEQGRFRWRFNLAALAACYPLLTRAPNGRPYGGPALFIRGGNSAYVGAEHSQALQTLFPHYRLETIAGAGHWLHGEQPALFNRLVQEFLG